jgi:hypothetical protein
MNAPSGFQVVMECFNHNRWSFQRDELCRLLRANFNGKHAGYRCLVGVEEADDLVQFATLLPFIVPADKRTAVAVMCVRLSYRLKDGRFDLNFENGELRFFLACAYPKGRLEEGIVSRALGLAVFIADHHLPIFATTLFGNSSPQSAIEQPHKPPRIDLN